MRRTVATLAICFIMCGCVGPLVPVRTVDDQSATQFKTTVAIVEPSVVPLQVKNLGPLAATSCKNRLWDKDASAEDATNQLRALTMEAGGNAMTNLKCDLKETTSLVKNCWTSQMCTATALRIADGAGR